jgi:hypothetical protein
MAVMFAFLQKEFDVVRVKNRFENDEVVEVSPEMMQAEFYVAETFGESTDSTNESTINSEKMYRDVNLNIRPKGSELICEVQLTLTGISILKKSEQKIYTLGRMTSAEELLNTYVFSEQRDSAEVQEPIAAAEPLATTLSVLEPFSPQSPDAENVWGATGKSWAGIVPGPEKEAPSPTASWAGVLPFAPLSPFHQSSTAGESKNEGMLLPNDFAN